MFEPRNPHYAEQTLAAFQRQNFSNTIGLEVNTIDPGKVTLALTFDEKLTQQHGFLHAGVTTTGMDNACGFAAFTLMPEDSGVLTVEFKTSLLAPATGERFTYVAEVIKAGRTLTYVEAKAYAHQGQTQKLIATMSATMMCISQRADIKG